MGNTASPLPDPLPGLRKSKYGVQFRRGQLCMFAGAPGAGKTTVALIAAIQMGVPTLYFSADSDEVTMAARTAAKVSGHTYNQVREIQAAGLYDEFYGRMVGRLPIRWVFDSEPSLEDISNAINAYQELWGTLPVLIVIDNLMNMRGDGDTNNEWAGMRSTVKALHYLARRTRACVWLLHHTSESSDQWITKAPPRPAIQGKLSQLPPLILTFANDEGVMWVGVVKQREGASDPLAKDPLRWLVDFAAMRLWDEPMMSGG